MMKKMDNYSGLIAVATATLLSVAVAQTAHATAIRSDAGFTASSLAANDDGSTGFVSFGFTVDFFGNSRSGGYVNNNGNLTMDSALSTYTPFGLISTSQEILAPFFADVDTSSAGSLVTYGTSTIGGQAAFGVDWIDVDYYNSSTSHTNRNSFQLVIIDRSDIAAGDFDFEFNIDQVQWEAGTASSSDADGRGGSCARVGWSNGSTDSFELAGSGVCGAFLDSGTPSVTPGSMALFNHELNSMLAIDSGGATTLGRYNFQVRGGTVVDPDPTIPEPGTIALFGLGIVGLTFVTRRKKNA